MELKTLESSTVSKIATEATRDILSILLSFKLTTDERIVPEGILCNVAVKSDTAAAYVMLFKHSRSAPTRRS